MKLTDRTRNYAEVKLTFRQRTQFILLQRDTFRQRTQFILLQRDEINWVKTGVGWPSVTRFHWRRR